MLSTIDRLQSWYADQCDGDWEHSFGVKIDTLDNPGWSVKIDLANTKLAGVQLLKAERGMSEEELDWLTCKSDGATFTAACGARNLEEVLEIFLRWAAEHGDATAP